MEKMPKRDEEKKENRFLVFILQSKRFGIELAKIREITKPLPFARLPGAHHYVQGLGNLRGEIIPILSLRKRLNIEGEEKNQQLIIIISKDISYGLLVDKIDGIYQVKEKTSKAINSFFSKGVETSFLSGVAEIKGKDTILIDSDKLIEINE